MGLHEPLITTSPDRLSGTPVFAGTRVPVQTLIEYLEAGDSLEAFLDDFPSVSREHAHRRPGAGKVCASRKSRGGVNRRAIVTMDKEKKARLEAGGWRVGSAEEFLNPTP